MARKATTFNAWICENAAKLKERLSLYSNIDEDAFQDAYLTLATTFDPKNDAEDYENAFLKAYRKFSGKNISETYTTCHPDELFFTLIPAEEITSEEKPEDADKAQRFIQRIRKHIRDTFPTTDVLAFEMKITGYSCRDISDTLGIGTTTINNATERIIAKTRLQFAAVAF